VKGAAKVLGLKVMYQKTLRDSVCL
jgi:hypothetical protein